MQATPVQVKEVDDRAAGYAVDEVAAAAGNQQRTRREVERLHLTRQTEECDGNNHHKADGDEEHSLPAASIGKQ